MIQCFDDTKSVPAEHSLNCIEATRLVHPNFHKEEVNPSLVEHCWESQSSACDIYGSELARNQTIYWRAIAQSIARFGLPEGPPKGKNIAIYQLAEFMEPYFATCREQNPEQSKNLPSAWVSSQRVNEPEMPSGPVPERGNELCIVTDDGGE